MAIQRNSIDPFLHNSSGALLIDVRSPAEYTQGHIPGAVNMPLFTDEERAVVGIVYKQQSRELAIKEGLDFFGPKMRRMVEEVEAFISNKSLSESRKGQPSSAASIFLYCWRGGMRSGAVAWLLDLYGYSVQVLAGGYKTYRRHVLDTMEQPFPFCVLGGYTGSGKTEVLAELKKGGHAIIDLEALASHKGSAFGKMGMASQPTQEMFENVLCGHLLEAQSKCNFSLQQYAGESEVIWIEDESQRIGKLNIPGALWTSMRKAPLYFLNIPFENRLAHIVDEYGAFDKEELAEGITRIAKRLGPLETKNALIHLEEGKVGDCFSILLKYYDKQYNKALHARSASLHW